MGPYIKDNVFVNLYEQIENKSFYKNENLPLVTPYIDKKTNVDHSTLYSISRPFEALHVDLPIRDFWLNLQLILNTVS